MTTDTNVTRRIANALDELGWTAADLTDPAKAAEIRERAGVGKGTRERLRRRPTPTLDTDPDPQPVEVERDTGELAARIRRKSRGY